MVPPTNGALKKNVLMLLLEVNVLTGLIMVLQVIPSLLVFPSSLQPTSVNAGISAMDAFSVSETS